MPPVTPPVFDPIYAIPEAEICNVALAHIGGEPILNTTEDTKQSRACRSVYAQTRDELLRIYPFNFATKVAWIPNDEDYASPMDSYTYAYKAEEHVSVAGTGANAGVTITDIGAGLVVDSQLIGRKVYGTNIQDNTRVVSVVETAGAQSITVDHPFEAAITAFSICIPIIKILEIDSNENNIFEAVGGGASRRILCNVSSLQEDPTGGDDPIDFLEMKYVEQVINPAFFDSMFAHALALRIASKICISLTKNPQIKQMIDQEFSSIFLAAKTSSSEEKQIDQPDPWWTDREASQSTASRR